MSIPDVGFVKCKSCQILHKYSKTLHAVGLYEYKIDYNLSDPGSGCYLSFDSDFKGTKGLSLASKLEILFYS